MLFWTKKNLICINKNRSILIFLLCFLPLPLSAWAETNTNQTSVTAVKGGRSLDRIVAIVNNDIVTQQQLSVAMDNVKKQIAQSQAQLPPEASLRKQVLDQLIDQKLELQFAQKMGLKAAPEQVNQAINNIAKRNNLTSNQLQQKLAQSGLTFEGFKKSIEQQIILNQLLQQVAGTNIKVTKSDVEEFLKTVQLQQQETTSQYHVLDILVALPEKPTPTQEQQTLTKAKEILSKIQHGTEVQSAIANQGDVQSQDLDWRYLPALPEIFAAPLLRTPTGGVAGPIKAPNGYHILKLLGKRGGQTRLPTQMQAQQILYQQKSQKELQKWLQEIRKQSYIRIND